MSDIPTASQIRQDFFDFFKSKQHTIVPSSSLMPDSPNLLFTNAGMNQFVPIFLDQIACPYKPGRAADTQKCIRAGGKHNDLEDVGLDTYHHTFFEMLGNWSFGDYFKKEAIEWAWELVVDIWHFPPQRLYATVFCPCIGEEGWETKWKAELNLAIAAAGTGLTVAQSADSGIFAASDQEAAMHWAAKFAAAGMDPLIHIVPGNRKDNFWMMGDTGPCGPCSELHVDLTPYGDTKGQLVNKGTAECIEIWNLVFIQFNANADGSFSPLPARHVDTGMGFERVCSIVQGTKGFQEFGNVRISNYETDVFRPIFDELEKMSGKRYASTLPQPNPQGQLMPVTEQEQIDVAFRVIADHIRTLSFAIADGIQPGNTDRNYVLRRILRRAVRYGRTLGFHEPFFYKLVEVLAANMGGVFPEIRAKHQFVKDVLKREEEAFNRTLDRGIKLFEDEIARLTERGAHAPSRAVEGAPPSTPVKIGEAAQSRRPAGMSETAYSKRHLPHFERPWGKYHVSFSTHNHLQLSGAERDMVLKSILQAQTDDQILLYAACVMPDHVHLLFEPQVKHRGETGEPIFWSLTEILQPIKSSTAHRITKWRKGKGEVVEHVWEKESFDRLMRSESDLQEKHLYIVRNPREAKLAGEGEEYPWLWDRYGHLRGQQQASGSANHEGVGSEGASNDTRGRVCSPTISGAFAFQLYDTDGFPLDLTELMARERGLTVDVEGFNKLMDEQRERARKSQKKQVIALSEIETKEPTKFVGYDTFSTTARVLEIVSLKDKTAVVLDSSSCYAEMGGQVGDSGLITHGADTWAIANTQKVGNTWLHFLEQRGEGAAQPDELDAPLIGSEVTLMVDVDRRNAIQRHHTVTHLLHWALHEVVSREASQKGSFVGSDKLTFDFNAAALTPVQVRDIERLVNERIVENAGVSWTEVRFNDVKDRKDVMQFFGDKYGDIVRVVQVGGRPAALDGYSMELCGGTHAKATGEIGLFRIVAESAIAAGVRRIEAVAGLEAYGFVRADGDRLRDIAARLGSPLAEVEKKLDAMVARQKEIEKALKALQQHEAASRAKELIAAAGDNAIIANLGEADGDYIMALAEALKSQFGGIVVLGGNSGGTVSLIASVAKEHQARVQAGKIIQAIAPIVGGKGGGKPDFARGGGKDASKLDEALDAARKML